MSFIKLKTWIIQKSELLLGPVQKILPARFYLAGGCFGKVVRDLDIFPVDGEPEDFKLKEYGPLTLLGSTKNATTYRYFDQVIQACKYKHPSLESLVKSFDFAHIQVGAEISNQHGVITVERTYFTGEFVTSRVMGNSWYTGSSYPLSSLVRLMKYKTREEICRGQAISSVISIVADIVERGVKDYDDFKDQLDAVDLGLLPEQMKDIDFHPALRLYEMLRK